MKATQRRAIKEQIAKNKEVNCEKMKLGDKAYKRARRE